MAVLEAMAAGLPVVISEHYDFQEVDQQEAGFVVRADDASVTEAILRLTSDNALRRQMGKNARNLIKEQYSWDSVPTTVFYMYSTIVETNERRPR